MSNRTNGLIVADEEKGLSLFDAKKEKAALKQSMIGIKDIAQSNNIDAKAVVEVITHNLGKARAGEFSVEYDQNVVREYDPATGNVAKDILSTSFKVSGGKE